MHNHLKGKKEKNQQAAELVKQMDADKDGKLSKTEVKGPLKMISLKCDTDKDGFLSLEELKKAPKPERKGPQV
jgi:Ca2+-binding EF-hand superfamily protein